MGEKVVHSGFGDEFVQINQIFKPKTQIEDELLNDIIHAENNYDIELQPKVHKLDVILFKIKEEIDITQEESDFLDEIDSIYIGHLNKKDYSLRENLCYFLNSKFEWYNSFKKDTETTDKKYYAKELWDEYKLFLQNDNFKFPRRKIMKYEDFKKYMRKHCIMRTEGYSENGNPTWRNYFTGLPIEKGE